MYKENKYFQLEPFGKRLEKVRIETGFTQLDVSKELDVARTQWLNFEKGRFFITLDKLAGFIGMVRKRNVNYSDLNHLIMGDPLGSWKMVGTKDVSATIIDNKDQYFQHLIKENERLTEENKQLREQNHMLMMKLMDKVDA